MSGQQIKEIFAGVLGIPIDRITDDLAYESIPEWDSLAHMTLIAVFDETFAITIAGDDISTILSVRKAREILARYGIST